MAYHHRQTGMFRISCRRRDSQRHGRQEGAKHGSLKGSQIHRECNAFWKFQLDFADWPRVLRTEVSGRGSCGLHGLAVSEATPHSFVPAAVNVPRGSLKQGTPNLGAQLSFRACARIVSVAAQLRSFNEPDLLLDEKHVCPSSCCSSLIVPGAQLCR